ncbi:MAG: hypothetical protein ACYDA4_04285 [Ignavibacteriaceae bacterium]
MKKYILASAFVISTFFLLTLNGCLVFHKISYEVHLETPEKGFAIITAYDMRSESETDADFQKDKDNLFQFMLKSKEFVDQQKKQGKDIYSRKLFVKDGILIGQAEYKFDSINTVENIKYEDGFHYLNLALDDSVLSTNGIIVMSKDFKRILWDKRIKILKFEMFSESFKGNPQRPLAPFYKKQLN